MITNRLELELTALELAELKKALNWYHTLLTTTMETITGNDSKPKLPIMLSLIDKVQKASN